MAETTVNFGPNMNYVVAQWDENNHRYKCCCQHCHVTTGTRIVGILEVIIIIIILSLWFVVNTVLISYSRALASPILWYVVDALTLFCLFRALKTERAGLLLPHLVMLVIGMSMMGFMALAFLLNLIGFSRTNLEAVVIAILLLIMGIAVGLQIWFFSVVKACYVYFKEKEAYWHSVRRSPISAGFTGVSYPAGQQQVPMNPCQMQPAAYSRPQQPPPYFTGFRQLRRVKAGFILLQGSIWFQPGVFDHFLANQFSLTIS